MNLLDIYNLYQSGGLTLSEAARALNLTDKDFKFRLTRWGHRLPLLFATLDKLKTDAISSKEAAEVLGVTSRQVNQLVEKWGITKPIKPYLVTRTASKIKWEVHKKFALDYIAGKLPIVDAAEAAGISERQMRRWVAELLNKHEEMSYKDHSKLALRAQEAIAKRIEERENLDIQKQMLAKAISDGEKTLQDEAISRVVYMKNRRATNVRSRQR